MSRTHLYELPDSGGRDRRIRMCDLAAFEVQRDGDRCELAERFTRQSKTTVGAIDEVVVSAAST
ncbi:hypothetical protein [Kribbella yunnanensis]